MDAIRMIGIVKCFGPVRANDGIDLIVGQQEIHCLLGENGTGKSTLMNILFGLYHPDAGEIFINEKKAAKQKAKEAAGTSWNETAWETEWSEGEGKDWDKVVIIPVVVTYDTNSTTPSIIGIQHDLKPTYAKLKGGDPEQGGTKLQIEVTYTSFNK